jgi:hypothetical protein
VVAGITPASEKAKTVPFTLVDPGYKVELVIPALHTKSESARLAVG